MEVQNRPAEDILLQLKTDLTTGLTESEACARREKFGENKLKEKKKKSLALKFLDQLKDVMIIILLIAALISFVIAIAEGNPEDFFEPALILFIVILNAIIGVAQENKAEKALEALKNMSAPHARVIRDGKEQIIDAKNLVVGDIILLEAGDFVPADARLIRSVSLKSEEAALTGESVPAEKDATALVKDDAPLGDRVNMVFSGCSITYGTATAVVVATGMNTEMGKIANLLNSEDESKTPLQNKLEKLGKYLGIIALAACAIIFVVGLITGKPWLEIFMIAVSLAVSAIPEGLPAIVTIVLSIGVQRMAKKNAIIKKLPAVETLGSASIICSDKTGTLTMNRMTLTKAYVDGQKIQDITNNNDEAVKKLLSFGTLCCDGSVIYNEGKEIHIGDPTETAIVLAAHKNGLPKDDLNKRFPRLAEIPFDSDRKLMTTINLIDGKNFVIVKGAIDAMESRCVSGDFAMAKAVNEEMSSGALRVLSIGFKEIETIPETLNPDEIENGLTFMGLVGMIDPPRPEAKKAVEKCREAGIKPIMITGDHVVTATAIAKELGIFVEGDRSITGVELDKLSENELDELLESISVYARVSPENKIRIVKAWQKKGQVVSMTGDGVNDAPALKAADIGCAMGITGTDVAKGAADMTLTDDNFATIVDAVEEGRGIYANIKKVVGFLLGTNIGEILCVFIAMLVFQASPLLAMQLLMVNLVTDSLPAISLGMEPVEKDVMKQKPKPKDEGIFSNGMGVRIIFQGFMFGLLALGGFIAGLEYGRNLFNLNNIFQAAGHEGAIVYGQTIAFITLSLSQVVQAFNMRSEKSLFRIGPFKNKVLNISALISSGLVSLVLFVPGLNTAFGLTIMPYYLYLIGLGLSFVPLFVMEIAKLIRFIHEKRHK